MAVRGQYGRRKVREGTVVSDKMQKTVVVAVEANRRHPLYKKIVRRVRRYMAHDEADNCRMGDRVRIVEARPLSRHKRWQVVEVLERSELPEVAPEAIDLELLGEIKADEEVAQDPSGPGEEPSAEPEPAPEAGVEEKPAMEEEPQETAEPEGEEARQ